MAGGLVVAERGRDYARVGEALRYLGAHYEEQPSLDETAAVVGLSPHHFQRVFTRYVGISPKKFVQHLSLERAKESLRRDASVMGATFDAGLSGTGRLHDLFVTHEAMTPGEWKAAAAGLRLTYGWHPSPFGDCLLIVTDRGVCGLAFAQNDGRDAVLAALSAQFQQADMVEAPAETGHYADLAFGRIAGELHLVLRGTPFQIKVWRALLRIPTGAVASYKQVASLAGQPTAARAIGRACATNAVAWLIPCHRVLGASGTLTGYRWGDDRKRVMLAWESAAAAGVAASA